MSGLRPFCSIQHLHYYEDYSAKAPLFTLTGEKWGLRIKSAMAGVVCGIPFKSLFTRAHFFLQKRKFRISRFGVKKCQKWQETEPALSEQEVRVWRLPAISDILGKYSEAAGFFGPFLTCSKKGRRLKVKCKDYVSLQASRIKKRNLAIYGKSTNGFLAVIEVIAENELIANFSAQNKQKNTIFAAI